MNASTETTPRALRIFTKIVAASTLFLVFAGAMVTSTDSGLAVPDWPLSYGMLMPPMVGGIFYEHGHRMIASAVGLLTLIQAFWLQRSEPKRFLRVLGWFSLAAVIVQGTLGGITVLFLLPLPVSVAHATLAEIFFCMNVAIAFFASKWFIQLKESGIGSAAAATTTRIVVAVTFLQIVLGALMRHLGAGLAIPDYPLSFGRVIPPLGTLPVAVNFAHRTWGLVVAAAIVVLLVRVFRNAADRPLRPLGGALIALVAVQITLGAFTIWTGKQPIVTSVHVATGALTFAVTVLAALVAGVRQEPVFRAWRPILRREVTA